MTDKEITPDLRYTGETIKIDTDEPVVISQDITKMNTVSFHIEHETVMEISDKGFFWKGEKVEDAHDIYTRFNEWLIRAEQEKN